MIHDADWHAAEAERLALAVAEDGESYNSNFEIRYALMNRAGIHATLANQARQLQVMAEARRMMGQAMAAEQAVQQKPTLKPAPWDQEIMDHLQENPSHSIERPSPFSPWQCEADGCTWRWVPPKEA